MLCITNFFCNKWALSSLRNKYMVLGYEIKNDFNWDQAEYQSCSANEEVLVAEKFHTATAYLFLSPIFWVRYTIMACIS